MHRSPTVAYLRGRERVLGGVWVHRDPFIAAELLAEMLGGRERALDWLDEVTDALLQGRAS